MADAEEKEAKNLDQTDFIDNSSFAFTDDEIFPSNQELNELDGRSTTATQTKNEAGNNKTPLLNKQMKMLLIGAGGFLGLLLVILLIVAVLGSGSGSNGKSNNDNGSSATGRAEIDEINWQIEQLKELEKSLVLPQVREPIVP